MLSRKKIYGVIITLIVIMTSCTPSKKYLIKKSSLITKDRLYVAVLILKTDKYVKLSSSERIRITDKRTGRILYNSQKADLLITPRKIRKPMIVESWNSYIKINGKPYRGAIELTNILGKLYVINRVSIDNYLYSVVPSEIPALWPEEALKAQAVASRTYIYYHLKNKKNNRFYDVDGTTSFQMYKGKSSENESTTRAVKSTRGEILTYKYEPILSYFHSTCGGSTTNGSNVWVNSNLNYLKGVSCSYCKESPHYNWTTKITIFEIKKNLQKKYPGIRTIKRIRFKRSSDRINKVIIVTNSGQKNLTGNEFRLLFPNGKIKSMNFSARKTGNYLILKGHGWGHGAGMCQWGARGMAFQGKNHYQILKYYFKDVKLSKRDKKFIAREKKGGPFIK